MKCPRPENALAIANGRFTIRFLSGSRLISVASLLACLMLMVLSGCKPAVLPGADLEIKTVKDPVEVEIGEFVDEMYGDFEEQRWEKLEAQAAKLRSRDRAVFEDGSYRLVHFYWAFSPSSENSDEVWERCGELHAKWLEANPLSPTAMIAGADFLMRYGWRARTGKWARDVTPEGWRLFNERLGAATILLQRAKDLEELDQMWWITSMSIARGQDYPESQQKALMEEAIAFDPKCWHFDVEYAEGLLPRWGGKKGAWEAYAAEAAARKDGLGAEAYARVVIRLFRFYDYIFDDTAASWSSTKEGLWLMRNRYPKSLLAVHRSARLASSYGDDSLGLPMADLIGNRYLPSGWNSPEDFQSFLAWAEEGRKIAANN